MCANVKTFEYVKDLNLGQLSKRIEREKHSYGFMLLPANNNNEMASNSMILERRIQ